MKKDILKNIICIPEANKQKRFLLGKRGKSILLAVGLNPSTADKNVDPHQEYLNNSNQWM